MLEEAAGSTKPIGVHEKHFKVCDEFRSASYLGRCEESLRRLVLERHYDAAAFLVSEKAAGMRGRYREPAVDLAFERFAVLMAGHISGGLRAIQMA